MALKNPIKFLNSYTRDDIDIFFGRKKETNRLYDTVKRSKIVLLYGLSGTGKTSLINCGLENKYKGAERTFVYIRRGNNINRSLNLSIRHELDSLAHSKASILQVIETLYYDYLKPITLVFDQFEELFISGDYNETQEFIETIATILNSPLKVKLIFSLREEYLAYMDEFEEQIPAIFDHRFRLEKMRRQTLEEVITNISQGAGISLESEAIPGLIIDNISDRKGYVDLPYLQVYLDTLSNRLKDSIGKNAQFTEKLVTDVGELDDVLEFFLEEQVRKIAAHTVQEKKSVKETADAGYSEEYIMTVLKKMVTNYGTKKQMTIEEFEPDPGREREKIKNLLAILDEYRIVKLDDEIYEFSHDSLAKTVHKKRTDEELQIIEVTNKIKNAYDSYQEFDTLLDGKVLDYIEPYLPKLKSKLKVEWKELIERSQSKIKWKKRIRVFWITTSIVVVLSALITYNIWMQKSTEYKLLVNKGEVHFNMGLHGYDSALIYYDSAKNLQLPGSDIDEEISKTRESIMKAYTNLAGEENKEGHYDIAIVHLAKAYNMYDSIQNWPEKNELDNDLLDAQKAALNEFREVIKNVSNSESLSDTLASRFENINDPKTGTDIVTLCNAMDKDYSESERAQRSILNMIREVLNDEL